MLKYSPEEYSALNLTKKDSESMKNITEKTREILNEVWQKTEKYLDKDNQEKVLQQARKILIDSAAAEETPEIDLAEIWEQVWTEIPEELDNSSEVYSGAWKGSREEMFFQLIMEEIPSLEISIDEDGSKYPSRAYRPNDIVIKAIPYKTDRVFLYKLERHPAISFLRYPHIFNAPFGKRLEQDGFLPKDMAEPILKKDFLDHIDYYKKELAADATDATASRLLGHFEEKLSEVQNTKSISEEEVREIMRKIIQDEFRKELLGGGGDIHETEA